MSADSAGTPAAPNLTGKTAIVTGATSGIGYEAALGLASLGARTVIAARNPAKAREVVARIEREVPGAAVRFENLDLTALDSVARFAAAVAEAHPVIDILVNNAAVMGLPTRQSTQDGFEQQIGVNYLAHFALTARLLPALCAAPGGGRVVNLASLAHRSATLNLDDFQSERSYGPMRAYGRSKLAMLVFALELQRRADANGWTIRSMAAHPGWARTSIIPNGMGRGPLQRLIELGFNLMAQPARDGALPLLFAATAPNASGGAYYGPTGWDEKRGGTGLARIYPQAADPKAGRELWALSERLTHISFDLAGS
ncbi:MAG TPA: SDR family oxidoreductase [Rhodopila sp.]|nr:SDR family oxidoreductase [Rhodopila sp.]